MAGAVPVTRGENLTTSLPTTVATTMTDQERHTHRCNSSMNVVSGTDRFQPGLKAHFPKWNPYLGSLSRPIAVQSLGPRGKLTTIFYFKWGCC